MTTNQAILELHKIKGCRMIKYTGLCFGDCIDCECMTGALDLSDACNMAICALKKQLPQKVLYRTTDTRPQEFIFGCPTCERAIFSRGRQYCTNCGQALDWSEVDK